eukprot:scaffold451_cov365-Prasinococcus_capsulatus_cf.AAC.18
MVNMTQMVFPRPRPATCRGNPLGVKKVPLSVGCWLARRLRGSFSVRSRARVSTAAFRINHLCSSFPWWGHLLARTCLTPA